MGARAAEGDSAGRRRSWSDERARVVLSHELAHIRRGDWIVQLSAELLRAIYWFNPLLWVACRRLGSKASTPATTR